MRNSEVYNSRVGQRFSGFVREHLAIIEADMAAGMPQERILEQIRAQTGFKEVSLKTLRTTIYRARDRAQKCALIPTQPQTAASPHASSEPAGPAPATSTVRFALVATPTFDFSPAKPGQDISRLVGPQEQREP